MKKLFYASAFFLIFVCANAAVDSVRGQIVFLAQKTQLIECNFSIETNATEGVSSVKIWSADSPNELLYSYVSEPGDMFLDSAKVDRLSNTSGNFLFIYWARGTSLIGLTVIGRSSDGKICTLFEDACRMGYQVIDVDENGDREIIAVDDYDSDNLYPVRVYRYTNQGKIELIRKIKAKHPHAYSIIEAKPKGPIIKGRANHKGANHKGPIIKGQS